jgi:hypothetical protein
MCVLNKAVIKAFFEALKESQHSAAVMVVLICRLTASRQPRVASQLCLL